MSEKETTKKEQPVAKKTQAPENVMYIGPTIYGMVQHSQVFDRGILPERADIAIKEFPQLKMMFVPLSKAPEAIQKLADSRGSAYKTIYNQCVAHFNTK